MTGNPDLRGRDTAAEGGPLFDDVSNGRSLKTPMEETKFFSTSEVAELFRINRVTVYRWAKEGKIKAYPVGKHYKIPGYEVKRLLVEFGFSGEDMKRFPDMLEKLDATGK